MRASNVQSVGRWLAMLALALAVTIGQAAPPAPTGHPDSSQHGGGYHTDDPGGGPGTTK